MKQDRGVSRKWKYALGGEGQEESVRSDVSTAIFKLRSFLEVCRGPMGSARGKGNTGQAFLCGWQKERLERGSGRLKEGGMKRRKNRKRKCWEK